MEQGIIRAVCISPDKGTKKKNIEDPKGRMKGKAAFSIGFAATRVLEDSMLDEMMIRHRTPKRAMTQFAAAD